MWNSLCNTWNPLRLRELKYLGVNPEFVNKKVDCFLNFLLQESEKVSEYPAVIVEPVPSARLEQGYAAQVLVYDDETYMMHDVAEEQEVETENVETGRHLTKCSLFVTFSFYKCQCYYCQLNDTYVEPLFA